MVRKFHFSGFRDIFPNAENQCCFPSAIEYLNPFKKILKKKKKNRNPWWSNSHNSCSSVSAEDHWKNWEPPKHLSQRLKIRCVLVIEKIYSTLEWKNQMNVLNFDIRGRYKLKYTPLFLHFTYKIIAVWYWNVKAILQTKINKNAGFMILLIYL